MTVDTDSAQRKVVDYGGDHALLVARAQVGLGVVFAAIVLMALADLRILEGEALQTALVVRLTQFALIGGSSLTLRIGMGWRARLAGGTTFMRARYVASGVPGCVGGPAASQAVHGVRIGLTYWT